MQLLAAYMSCNQQRTCIEYLQSLCVVESNKFNNLSFKKRVQLYVQSLTICYEGTNEMN